MTEEQLAAQTALVQKAIDLIGEHFDTVQIFVTKHEPSEGGTHHIARGVGNWFARSGQVHDWILKENEDARESVRAENSEQDD